MARSPSQWGERRHCRAFQASGKTLQSGQGKHPIAAFPQASQYSRAVRNQPLLKKMKTIKSLILTASAIALCISPALALPPWKGGPALETIEKKTDVEKIGAKSQLVLVCKASNTVTVIDIKDEQHAKALCAEGTMIECKDCRKKYHVTWKNPTGKTGGPDVKMEIVNAQGHPCMFLARLN